MSREYSEMAAGRGLHMLISKLDSDDPSLGQLSEKGLMLAPL